MELAKTEGAPVLGKGKFCDSPRRNRIARAGFFRVKQSQREISKRG
jgi:hypothetical protein